MGFDALYRPQRRRHNAPGSAFQNSWRYSRQLCPFICGFSKKELVNSEGRTAEAKWSGDRKWGGTISEAPLAGTWVSDNEPMCRCQAA